MDYRAFAYQSAAAGFVVGAFALSSLPSCSLSPIPFWVVLLLLVLTIALILLPIDPRHRGWYLPASILLSFGFLGVILFWLASSTDPWLITVPVVLVVGAYLFVLFSVAHRSIDRRPFSVGGAI